MKVAASPVLQMCKLVQKGERTCPRVNKSKGQSQDSDNLCRIHVLPTPTPLIIAIPWHSLPLLSPSFVYRPYLVLALTWSPSTEDSWQMPLALGPIWATQA